MKRLVLALLLGLLTFPLLSSPMGKLFQNKNAFKPNFLYVAEGNDKYNYGITRNQDDQLSYALITEVEAPLWAIRTDVNGITNRGWREGWDPEDPDVSSDGPFFYGRYDSFETTAKLKLILLDSSWILRHSPEVGFAVIGDFGWVWAQNMVHRLTDIHEVDLPYDTPGERTLYPMLGSTTSLGYRIRFHEDAALTLEAELNAREIFSFQSEVQFRLKFSAFKGGRERFSFFTGHLFASDIGEEESKTQDLYLHRLSGWRIGYTLDMGILILRYTGNLETDYGYGTFGINPLALWEPKTWKESNLSIRLGTVRAYDKTGFETGIGKALDDRWELRFSSLYIQGNPLGPEAETETDFSVFPRQRLFYSSTSLGLRAKAPSFWNDFIEPYAELRLGFQHYEIVQFQNQTNRYPYPEEHTPWGPNYPLLSLEAGTVLLKEGSLVIHDNTFQVELFGGINILFGNETELDWFKNYQRMLTMPEEEKASYSPDKTGSHFIPYFGIAARIGMDL